MAIPPSQIGLPAKENINTEKWTASKEKIERFEELNNLKAEKWKLGVTADKDDYGEKISSSWWEKKSPGGWGDGHWFREKGLAHDPRP